MLLSTLLQDIYLLPAQADREIQGLTLDSRKVSSHDLFLAFKGARTDGREFIEAAIGKGANAVLIDSELPDEGVSWREATPIIPVSHLQHKIGQIAAQFYHHPAKKLRMLGVTGTSGKTSCTQFIAQCLQARQVPCGIIGTLGSGFNGALIETGLTTPDALTLQATLNEFVNQGAEAVAIEVSSHSIDQGRVNGIEFEIGIFTNLSQDHLDYHGDMASYAQVKRRFLADLPTNHLVINWDDSYGKEWVRELHKQKPVVAYSTKSEKIAHDSVYPKHVRFTLEGIEALISTPWGEGRLMLPLVGQFNLSNGLAVLSALCLYGVPLAEALVLLSQLKTVPGRMQTLGGLNKPLVVVDYAHKPDALQKVLQALRDHTEGKLICVFGCGGERDRGKRPIMANIAEALADQVIVTNDNPRHECAEAIAAEIMQGFKHPERVFIELDRSKAIQNSIQWASVNDCVLIAGKGAERYQQIGDEKLPFDDVDHVKRYLY